MFLAPQVRLSSRRDTIDIRDGDDEKVEEEGYSNQSRLPQNFSSNVFVAEPTQHVSRARRSKRVVVGTVPEGVTVVPELKVAESPPEEEISSVYERFESALPTIPTSRPTPRPTKTSNEVKVSFAIRTARNEKLSVPAVRPTPDGEHAHDRSELLNILATTDSLSHAWDAYQNLMALPRDGDRLPIPWEHLHRLTRLFASTKPRTRTLFLRLLTVISTIHKTGGRVSLWQWNALIDFAGKGWRKTRQEDFRNAMGVFNDLVSTRPPGATFSRSELGASGPEEQHPSDSDERPSPDIVTYTTLLNIAARTLHPLTFEHASMMLHVAGIPPNRITLLTRLRYYSRRGELPGMRAIISQLREHNFDLGLDGINACIWAYGRNERLEVASAIYAVLKNRLSNLNGDQEDENILAFKQFLESQEGIQVPDGILPDRVTFTGLLQSFAYHGDLVQCLQVFMDMISVLDKPSDANAGGERNGKTQTMYMMPAYRAIFLGFVRHGKSAQEIESERLLSYRLKALHNRQQIEPTAWTLNALEALFTDFLALSSDAEPSERMIYWILVAYGRCTGDDVQRLREVFLQLEERFGGGWGGRLARMRKRLFSVR